MDWQLLDGNVGESPTLIWRSDMNTIQQKLRRFETLIDPQYRTKREFLINPDGIEAANYIDNFHRHMGYVIQLALEHIEDEGVHAQITRHGYAALKGVK
jgi:hypothetical protein